MATKSTRAPKTDVIDDRKAAERVVLRRKLREGLSSAVVGDLDREALQKIHNKVLEHRQKNRV